MEFFRDQSYNSAKVFFLLALIIGSGMFIMYGGGNGDNSLLGRVFNKKNTTYNPLNNNIQTGINIVVPGSNVASTSDCTAANAGFPGSVRYCNEIFSQLDIPEPSVSAGTSGIVFSSTYGLKFDVYTPPLSDTATNRAAVIHFHGGGGDETSAGPCKQYASFGYVCFSGDYRNDDAVKGFSSAEQKHATSDAQAALRYIRIHASEYGIDPNRIMLSGISAGGTVALEAAVSGNNLDNVNWFSSSDLEVNRDNQFGIVSSKSCVATSNSGAPMVSTNSLIDAGDPPTSLFLGENDLSHGWTCNTGQVFTDAMTLIGILSYSQCFPDTAHSLNQGPAIDAVVIPMVYKEMIVESCTL